MSYGQSIPPRIVHDTASYFLTKAAYAHHIAKMLHRVGMLFLPGMSSYDVLDPRFEEGPFDFGSGSPFFFWFDYPTVESFTVNGVEYVPMLGYMLMGDSLNGTAGSLTQESFMFVNAVRPKNDNRASEIRNIRYYRDASGSTNFGFGSPSSTLWASQEDGAAYRDPLWQTSWLPAWATGPSFGWTPINVQNSFAALGPGGLVLCTGRGQGAAEFSVYHAFACAFFGDRIPGRGRTPINDPNLTRINPVVLIPFRSTFNVYRQDPGSYELGSYVNGAQFDLQSAPDGRDPILAWIYNLANVDRPVFPDYAATVRNSPRLVGGQGRHLLDPLILIPQNRWNTPGEMYSAVVNYLGTAQSRPPWEDIFFATKARLSDVTAPIGQYEDPDSLLDWWLVPMANTGLRWAVEVEGRTDETNTVVPATTLDATESFDLTSAGFGSTFPRALAFAQSMSAAQNVNQHFLAVGGQNAMLATWPYHTLNSWRRTVLQFEVPPAEDPERLYVVVFEAYVRSTMVGVPTTTANAPYIRVSILSPEGTEYTRLALLAGRAPAENSYDLTTYRIPLTLLSVASAPGVVGHLNVLLLCYDPSAVNPGGTHTCRVENIRIERRSR